MMLLYYLLENIRELVLVGQLNATLDMGCQNHATEARWYPVMGVAALKLVFDEKVRASQFADVMIVRPNPGQDRISPHYFSCSFRQIPHQNAVMVSARRFQKQTFKGFLVWIGQLQ